jgi:hypothetical protein
MLNCKAQPHLADAVALVLRAQLSATSEALAAALRGGSMLWTQMLTTWPAMDEQPAPPTQPWSITGPLLWPIPGPLLWPIPWPVQPSLAWSIARSMAWPMHWPSPRRSPKPWQDDAGDGTRLGFVPLAPFWWTAGRAFWVPSASAGTARQLAAHQMAEPPSAAYATVGPDASFASYRSAGGHALAQVIVPPAEELAGATAKAWRSPLEAMLGVWRAALGV